MLQLCFQGKGKGRRSLNLHRQPYTKRPTNLYGFTNITNYYGANITLQHSMPNPFVGTRRTERKAQTIYRVFPKSG
jgi:hypothetical protein